MYSVVSPGLEQHWPNTLSSCKLCNLYSEQNIPSGEQQAALAVLDCWVVLMFDDESEVCHGRECQHYTHPLADTLQHCLGSGMVRLNNSYNFYQHSCSCSGSCSCSCFYWFCGGDTRLTQRQIYGVSRRQHLILYHLHHLQQTNWANTPGHQGSLFCTLMSPHHHHTSTPCLRYSIQRGDRAGVCNLLVNFDAETIWKIFTIFYWNILSWILWNLDKKCSEQFCSQPNFYLTSRSDFKKEKTKFWCSWEHLEILSGLLMTGSKLFNHFLIFIPL